jgi:hypothetical protein
MTEIECSPFRPPTSSKCAPKIYQNREGLVELEDNSNAHSLNILTNCFQHSLQPQIMLLIVLIHDDSAPEIIEANDLSSTQMKSQVF